jgi:hypothetical protein
VPVQLLAEGVEGRPVAKDGVRDDESLRVWEQAQEVRHRAHGAQDPQLAEVLPVVLRHQALAYAEA